MGIDWLLERMETSQEKPAIIWKDRTVYFKEISNLVAYWKTVLSEEAIAPGSIVSLEGDFSPNTISLLLALIDNRSIVVPLTQSSLANRAEFLDIAEVQFVVSFGEQDAWHIERRAVQVANPLSRRLIEIGDPGLVLFSSGSTGKSKAALHNFTHLLEKFKRQGQTMLTIVFLLLDHIGGINTLLHALSSGGCVISLQSRDPEMVCQTIERHKVELLPTSPTFLNLLLISEAYKHYDLSSLKKITYGTEVMPQTTLEKLHSIFPEVTIQQTYGLSELGILRSKSRDSSSLWVKVGGEGFETKIVDGTLWIRANSAMMGYLNAPSPFDAEGWMDTQDMVEVDGEYIHILGRRTEIINVGGQKVYPADVESVLMQMENVRDVSVYGEKNPIMGAIVVARFNLFEPEELASLKQRVRSFCRERLAAYKIPARIEITEKNQYSERFKKMRRASDAK
jgi:acyl-CoA synthetase (AMP-forming)/AMP-acid ligase II